MTLDDWLRAHAFLVPLARVRAQIDAAIAAAAPPCPAPPCWDDYRDEYRTGVPLLQSTAVAVDVHGAGNAIVSAIGLLARAQGAMADEARALDSWLRADAATPRQLTDWLLGGDEFSPPHEGLLRCAGWLTLTASLAPLVSGFAEWRTLADEQQWMRSYCPTCGSLPAMGQLVGVDPGRQRFLSCGRCATIWRYGRTHCPFCQADSHKLASVAPEGEHGLRIDYCESCAGYLKTYAGQGSEGVLLADWTSLHLDIAAQERGWRRVAASLYEIDPPGGSAPPSLRGASGNPEVSSAR